MSNFGASFNALAIAETTTKEDDTTEGPESSMLHAALRCQYYFPLERIMSNVPFPSF
jgi:hypothetical protein